MNNQNMTAGVPGAHATGANAYGQARKPVICYTCGTPGHISRNCQANLGPQQPARGGHYQHQQFQSQAPQPQQQQFQSQAAVHNENAELWARLKKDQEEKDKKEKIEAENKRIAEMVEEQVKAEVKKTKRERSLSISSGSTSSSPLKKKSDKKSRKNKKSRSHKEARKETPTLDGDGSAPDKRPASGASQRDPKFYLQLLRDLEPHVKMQSLKSPYPFWKGLLRVVDPQGTKTFATAQEIVEEIATVVGFWHGDGQ